MLRVYNVQGGGEFICVSPNHAVWDKIAADQSIALTSRDIYFPLGINAYRPALILF